MTISSNNFPIEGDYKVLWSSTSNFGEGKTIILKEGTSPRNNFIVVTTFNVPSAPAGMYYVGFIRYGRDDPPTTFSFIVMPRLLVQPLSAAPGNTVTVYGSGLPANDAVSLTFDSKPTNVTATADNNGSLTINFAVPSAPANEHQISASSPKLTATITPATLLVVPGITVDPQSPQAGSQVTITGRGFAAKSTVSIKYNDLVITSSPSTDDSGNLTYSFTLPQSSDTGYRFVATDQSGNSATLSSGAKAPTPQPSPPPSTPPATQPPSTPPAPQNPNPTTGKTLSKPSTIAPRDQSIGLLGAQEVTFVWTQASSFPGNISYTLEVSDNHGFLSVKPTMRAVGIAQTNHTLNLEPGAYYWRVKAVDSFGNESEWANSPSRFQVGTIPLSILIVGAIIYMVILYLLIRAFLRRRNRDTYYYY